MIGCYIYYRYYRCLTRYASIISMVISFPLAAVLYGRVTRPIFLRARTKREKKGETELLE